MKIIRKMENEKYPKNYQILLTLGHIEANLRNYKKA